MTTKTDAAAIETDIQTRTVNVFRVYIKATPEAIWEAITSPEWNGKYGYHMSAEYDLKPGGAYRVGASPEMVGMGMPETVLDGEVLESDPPKKLVQTWKMFFSEETSSEPYTTITYEIEPESDQLTRLTLTHDVTGAPNTEAQTLPTSNLKLVEGGGGWSWILSDLKSLLEGGEALALD